VKAVGPAAMTMGMTTRVVARAEWATATSGQAVVVLARPTMTGGGPRQSGPRWWW
jgi:hypothetical protein